MPAKYSAPEFEQLYTHGGLPNTFAPLSTFTRLMEAYGSGDTLLVNVYNDHQVPRWIFLWSGSPAKGSWRRDKDNTVYTHSLK